LAGTAGERANLHPLLEASMHRGLGPELGRHCLPLRASALIPMCFLAEEYLQICENEFRTVRGLPGQCTDYSAG
jgi:hypothetical protein